MPRNKYHDTPAVEFHEAFGAPIAWRPTVPPEDRRLLRLNLILEELLEFGGASGFTLVNRDNEWTFTENPVLVPNVIEAADTLADIRYVTEGAALEWGIPLEKCVREVHRSNMSKLGANGKPILREDGKILKGPGYTPPRIADLLFVYPGIDNSGGGNGET